MDGKEITLTDIRNAMDNHEFVAYYQPQYNALTNKIASAEALVRWPRPDGTTIMPGVFVPLLEQSDAIIELDWYILEEVCRFLETEQDAGNSLVPIGVNFSRWHVDESGFLEKLCAVTERHHLARELVVVELTESAFADCCNQIADWVGEIQRAGFSVAIDDFGSGLSSLSFVKDISFDILKIDKALISKNCEDEKERIVLESIFTFAHRLHLTTVAEGVETIEQLSFLRTCDCKLIQGYFFARPMPEDEFRKLCVQDTKVAESPDILTAQAPFGANQLLLEVVFTRYPLIIFSNLSRNSYYMMAYDNFTSRSCPSTGVFSELIRHGAASMLPEEQALFENTFCIENQLSVYEKGEKSLRLVTHQLGDDGIYRKVETANYFVKHPSSDDILVFSLCQNLD